MQTVYHAADTRGHVRHGWLDTKHTFSFGSYRNPERVHFGALRVINDDWIDAGQGFGTHPHNDMEIITIPLSGSLKHQDSMGNGGIIRSGDIQVMSAGTGIAHSEINASADEAVTLLQIWVFPRENGVTPRYQQITLPQRSQALQTIVSPDVGGEGVWIHQDAWFTLAHLSAGSSETYRIRRNGNGVYAFVINGCAVVAGHDLQERDGLGVWQTDELVLQSESGALVLLMDVPMAF